MSVLRYVYLLALAVWIGGMTVLGAIAAPAIFQVLPAQAPGSGRALAGAAFGAILARFHYVAYGAGSVMLAMLAAMALLGPRPRHFAVRMALIATMLGVSLYSGRVVLGEIDDIQRQLASGSGESSVIPQVVLPSQLPATDRRRLRFDRLHQLSTRLMMLNVAGALALLVWEAREHAK